MVDAQEEQMKQIVDFLDSKEARGQALEIILGFTATEEQRQLFFKTEICKKLLQLVVDADAAKHQVSVFQILINLAQDKAYVEKCCTLNAARKVFEFLMKNVTEHTGAVGADAKQVKVQRTEEGGFQAMYEINKDFASSIQCAFMFLSNISMLEEGQIHLLGEGKTKGSIMENLIGMFNFFKANTMFDFVSNIVANVCALKVGRKWFIESGIINQIFNMLLDKPATPELTLNDHRKKHLIQSIRNMLFEYEDYEKDFIQMDILDKLFRLLVIEQGLTEHSLPDSWLHLKGLATKELFLNKISMENCREILDSVVLLANSDHFLKQMDTMKVDILLQRLKMPTFGETRQKVDVILAQMATVALGDLGCESGAADEAEAEAEGEDAVVEKLII